MSAAGISFILGAAPAAAQSSGTPEPTATTSDGTPIEVTIHGDPSATSGGAISPRESRLVPGTFGDSLRAVETLPGVSPTANGLPYFYVRGAPPANSGYFIDGIPVPLLFHIGPGPSILSPGLVDHVDFYPGSQPAQYGGYLGGAITADTTAPSDVRRIQAGVRSFDANALVETPLGGGTSVLLSGRYGYPNVLLNAIGSQVSLKYWDYGIKLSKKLNARDTVSLFAFGADDSLHDNTQNADLFAATVHRVDLRYDRRLDHGSFRIAATIAYDRTGQGAPGQPVNNEVVSLGPRLRIEWKKTFGETVALSAGADAGGIQARYDYGASAAPSQVRLPHMDGTAGVYLDARVRFLRQLEVSPGVRFNLYEASTEMLSAVDPRLSARYQMNDVLAWTASGSIAHQLPTFLVPAPGLDFDIAGGLQRAYEAAFGGEVSLPSRLFVSMSAFYTALQNSTDYVAGCGQRPNACSIVDRVSGRTYGLEVLVKRPLSKRLSGWIAYTLSRAERSLDSQDNLRFLSPFDRTQVFSGVADYNFGAGYRAGVRVTYYSGRPDLPQLGNGETPITLRPGESAQHRLPDFYRLDLRAEKTWVFGASGGHVAVVLEFFNATLTKEAYNWQCDFSGTCNARMIGPIALPSLGLEGGL